jgi:hypothetical protein
MNTPTPLDRAGHPVSEDLEERLASADPADAPELAEELADRLESVLNESEERGDLTTGRDR